MRFGAAILACFVGVCGAAESAAIPSEVPIRIGYFHGFRMHMLFQTYVNGYFERQGVELDLYSKYLGRPGFHKVPRSYEGMKEALQSAKENGDSFGKATGVEVIDAIERGTLDGGVVGESSFLSGVARGSPIVAVATLSHFGKGATGRWLVLRNDLIINKPEDFKGKTFGTRRAGPGDAMLLREFFARLGLKPGTDVEILEQISNDGLWDMIKKKKIHGMLAHFGRRSKNPEKWGYDAYAYRQIDSANPEITLGLLVFRKDFLESHRDQVQKVVAAYMQRTLYERSLPEDERVRVSSGLATAVLFEGKGPPDYDYPPLIRMDLLEEAQRLLLKHGYIDKKTDLAPYVDQSFVKTAAGK